jgi:hypothetical protein
MLTVQGVGASMFSTAGWSVRRQLVTWSTPARHIRVPQNTARAAHHPSNPVQEQDVRIHTSISMMPGCPAADLVVLVSNNIGGSANSGTTGNWIKLQITVSRKHLCAPAACRSRCPHASGSAPSWHGTRRQVACLCVLRISVLLTIDWGKCDCRALGDPQM